MSIIEPSVMTRASPYIIMVLQKHCCQWRSTNKICCSSNSIVQLRKLSTDNTSSSVNSSIQLGLDTATVVRGPSLLTATGVDRPSPSLFFLPGLRSLPFWTAPHPNSNGATKVAFQDPKVTSVVRHVESHTNQIREEYLCSVSSNQAVESTKTSSSATSTGTGKPLKMKPDYDINRKGGEHSSEALHTGQVRVKALLHFNNNIHYVKESIYISTASLVQ